MYERLVEALRNMDVSDACPCSAGSMCADQDCIVYQAADTIEELSGMIDRYGGETGIKILQKYANKYWNLLKKVPRWISVTEGLPRAGELDSRGFAVPYLVMNGHKRVTARRAENYWVLYGEGLVLKDVTHWMPLPEPPKEET